MKCIIYYERIETAKLRRFVDDLVASIYAEGIDYVRVSAGGLVVDTPHIHATFTNDMNKFKGRMFDEIFGNISSDCIEGRFKEPKKERFYGSVLEYILQEEGVKRL